MRTLIRSPVLSAPALETTYRWADRAGATAMELRDRGEPSGFSKLAVPFMAPAIRRANRGDLKCLKSILERG